MKKGKVFLIGAGPGDEKLLTIKAAEIIAKANVIVYDKLVSSAIMAKLPSTAKKINVGKSTSNHIVPQEEINNILLEQALLGNTVVRLKGGDPFVFGRGGEELELLFDNNIEFEVVPGITSSIAAAAYGGIPVTHRDFCSSLHIITGHAKKNGELNIDFNSLSKLGGTLVFMMSVSSVGEISKGLLTAGMTPQMPCAVIENGTRYNQRKFVSTLESIAQVIAENQVKSPAVILVGRVCTLSDKFDWFSKKPLIGKQILIAQPWQSSSRLSEKLSDLGCETVLYPAIETKAIENISPPLDDYSTLVFTSARGVEAFFEHLYSIKRDSRILYNKKIAAIGSQTAKALQSFGIICDFIPPVFDGATLANEMLATNFITKQDKLLLLRAQEGDSQITEILTSADISFLDYPVYKTNYLKHEDINLEDFDYITFTSRSCVTAFVKNNTKESYCRKKALCIGETTAKQAREEGFEVIVATTATLDSMVEALLEDVSSCKEEK